MGVILGALCAALAGPSGLARATVLIDTASATNVARGYDLGWPDGTSFGPADRRWLPAARDLAAILDVWLMPAIHLQLGSAPHAALETPRWSAYGRSWRASPWAIDGLDVSDPWESGAPLIAPPWSAWRGATWRALQRTYREGLGLDFSVRIPPPRSTGSGGDVNLDLGAAWIDETGGPTFIPAGFMDGEPGTARGAPAERRTIVRQAQLDGSFTLALGAHSAVWGAAEYRRLDRHYLTIADDETGRRTRAGLGLSAAGAWGEGFATALTEFTRRTALGAEYRQPLPDTADLRADAVHLQAGWDGRRLGTDLRLDLGATYRSDVRRTLTDLVASTEFTHDRIEPGTPPMMGDAYRTLVHARGRWSPQVLVGAFQADLRLARIHYRPEASTRLTTYRGQPLWADETTPHGALTQTRTNADLGYALDGIWRWVSYEAAAGLGYERAVTSTGNEFFTWLSPTGRLGFSAVPISDLIVRVAVVADRAPLPYEALLFADSRAPSTERRFWLDGNGDGQVAPDERGTVVRRGGGDRHEVSRTLRPPREWELYLGTDMRLAPGWQLLAHVVQRWYSDNATVVHPAAELAQYGARAVTDPGGDGRGELHPLDSQVQYLTAYEKHPSLWGNEHYVLTNAAGFTFYQGLELQLRTGGAGWFLNVAGTAYRIEGSAPFGNGPEYNDYAAIDEMSADPNAQVNAWGRLDADRALGLNILSGVLLFDDEAAGRLGLSTAIRYRDGETYARLLAVDGLAQGPVLLQAVSRGSPRYTFHMTWDVRLAYQFVAGPFATTLEFDLYNLLDSRAEIAEEALSGGMFRSALEVVPPRTFMVRLEAALL